jgi:hypothetical protein
MSKLWLIPALCIVVACTTIKPDLPEEAQDSDGNGAAMVKMSFVQWLGQLVLTAVDNVTVNIKVDHGSTFNGHHLNIDDKQPA